MSYQTGIGPRTAVVTGASSTRGIGFQTALRFTQEGWAVVMLDMNEEGLALAADRIREQVPEAQLLTIALNVTDEQAVKASAAQVSESGLPPVGALANIAGIPAPDAFLDLTVEVWNKVMAVDLTGPFLLSQAFLPAMIDGGYGSIVNMSSVTAQHGGGVFSKTAYAAAKAGLLGLTRGVAREFAEYGITCNAVAPGVVDTDIRVGTSDEIERKLAEDVPLKRQALPSEVAALVVWLCSEDSRYITGITHAINGGTYVY